MIPRKIQDAKDLKTGEKVYLKGHAKVTYMSDGISVEDAITELRQNGGGGTSSATGTLVVNILSNQANDTDIANVQAVVIYGDKRIKVSSGEPVKIPVGVEVLVEFPKVNGYDKPADVSLMIGDGDNTAEGTYTTKLITVNVTTEDGVSTDGVKVTIQKVIAKPMNLDFSVLLENKVAIMDIEGKFYATVEDWVEAGRPTPNGVAATDGLHAYCIAMHNSDKPIYHTSEGTSPIPYQQFGDMVAFSSTGTSSSDESAETEQEARNTFLMEFFGEEGDMDIPDSETTEWFSVYGEYKSMILFIRVLLYILGSLDPRQDVSMLIQILHSFPSGYFGMLGAAGDWVIAAKHAYTIDTLMRGIGGTPLCNNTFGIYWTATTAGDDEQWTVAVEGYGDSGVTEVSAEAGDETEAHIGALTKIPVTSPLPSLRLFTVPFSVPKLEATSEVLTVSDGKVTFKLPTNAVGIVSSDDMEGYAIPPTIGVWDEEGQTDFEIQYFKPVELPQYTIQAVDANNNLIDWHYADSDCKGVVLTFGNKSFMVSKYNKSDAQGAGYSMYGVDQGDTNAPNYLSADGVNERGYLPEPTGYYVAKPKLSPRYEGWVEGALSDFDGKTNTEAIVQHGGWIADAVAEANNNTYYTFNDWYIPSCGQLALIYLAKDELNEAFAAMGYDNGLNTDYPYWSSSEYDADYAWSINFSNGNVGFKRNDSARYETSCYLRLVRDVVFPEIEEQEPEE